MECSSRKKNVRMNAKSDKINICLKESYIVWGEEKFTISVFIPHY